MSAGAAGATSETMHSVAVGRCFSSGCHNKTPQTGRLKTEVYGLAVLEAEVQLWGAGRAVPLRPLPLPGRRQPCHRVLAWPFLRERALPVCLPPLRRTLVSLDQGPSQQPHFNFITSLKAYF